MLRAHALTLQKPEPVDWDAANASLHIDRTVKEVCGASPFFLLSLLCPSLDAYGGQKCSLNFDYQSSRRLILSVPHHPLQAPRN